MHRVVFLSSTGKDLRDYRQAVIDHLAKLDHFLCDAQENFGARDARAIDFCRERVRKADIFVGLIGHYRGWEPPIDDSGRSITEMEYDWPINAELGDLSGVLLARGAGVTDYLLSFQRYNLGLDEDSMNAPFGVPVPADELARLHAIDDPGVMERLHGLAAEAARMQVRAEDFKGFLPQAA